MSVETSRSIPAENLRSSSFPSNLIKQGAGHHGGTKHCFRGQKAWRLTHNLARPHFGLPHQHPHIQQPQSKYNGRTLLTILELSPTGRGPPPQMATSRKNISRQATPCFNSYSSLDLNYRDRELASNIHDAAIYQARLLRSPRSRSVNRIPPT